MKTVLENFNGILWSIPVLCFILYVGLKLSIHSNFAQIRLLPKACRKFVDSLNDKEPHRHGTSAYRALCTALAATVGTGNIAGVAGAIALGGPGVVFWMWVCALLCMVTKFAEVTLAIHFRTRDYRGKYTGGPMYIIQNGLPGKFHFLSYIYCFLGVVASFGIGNAAQINAIADGVRSTAASLGGTIGTNGILVLGIVLSMFVWHALRGEVNGVGQWAEKLVPIASIIYILLSIIVLILRMEQIPDVFAMILRSAFEPKAFTGGVVGSVFLTLRIGVSRGVFTNEAGMGTASIAHSSADVSHPVEQGLMGIMEVFLDTIVICTLTALVILCSGFSIPYGTDPGITLTLNAFSAVCGDWSRILLTVLVCVFAFATILGWGLYGGKCTQYLFGEHAWKTYILLQSGAVILGAVMDTSVVWVLSEIFNGLMAIPNMIALTLLSPVFISILRDYKNKRKAYSLQ